MNRLFDKKQPPKKGVKTAREIAFAALFVALVIGAQFVLSAVPGIELVTVLFTAYAFVFGAKKGMLAATAFSLVRQFVFGFFPNVLILYLVYYNALALCMGALGKMGEPKKGFVWVIVLACVCTVGFHLLDFLLTAIIGGYSDAARQIYFSAMLPVLFTQVICAAVTVGALFLPLCKIFLLVKGKVK